MPLALIISERFSPSPDTLELDLGFSGEIQTAGQGPPNLKNFIKMAIVPLCPLEHDLGARGIGERPVWALGQESLLYWWPGQWWSCVPGSRTLSCAP